MKKRTVLAVVVLAAALPFPAMAQGSYLEFLEHAQASSGEVSVALEASDYAGLEEWAGDEMAWLMANPAADTCYVEVWGSWAVVVAWTHAYAIAADAGDALLATAIGDEALAAGERMLDVMDMAPC